MRNLRSVTSEQSDPEQSDPATDDPQCYAPFCDANGQCGGNLFVGKPFTAAGNWTDGTQGVRTWPYTIQTPDGPVTYPGNQFCTVGQSSDVGNTLYPQCAYIPTLRQHTNVPACRESSVRGASLHGGG